MGELKLNIPEDLREALAAEAASEGVSLDTLTTQAIEAYLEVLKTRRFFAERAANADPEWLKRFLDREGGEPPRPGDELPEGYRRKG
ncbi:MAG: toxin-antitoxin system HicB family antitoxin [Micropepsaceae bacterium]